MRCLALEVSFCLRRIIIKFQGLFHDRYTTLPLHKLEVTGDIFSPSICDVSFT